MDVSNPTSPTLVQHINSKESGDIYGANNLYVIGNYLYVASNQGAAPRIKVYDISNSTNPSLVNTITTSFNVLSFDYDGIYLYCGLSKYDGNGNNIVVYRMNNLASPTLVASANTKNGGYYSTSVVGIAVRMGHIYTIGSSLDDNAVPTAASITGTKPASRYGTGTVVLSATATGGTINWYAAASGGSSLGTGANFTTPSITTTTTYYVAAADGNCASARTPVIATVVEVPPCINSSSDLGTPTFTNTGIDVKTMYRSGDYIYFIGQSFIKAYNIS